jgi:putative hydrolase of the HAD superfamily
MDDFAERYFGALQTNDPMLAFLRSCRDERGLRLALLTNNVREWEPRWRAMIPDIDDLFELIVDSAFVGMRKPDPAIYTLTTDRLGVAPEACLFIDDLEVNCDAARDVGMAAVRFETTEQTIAEASALLDG